MTQGIGILDRIAGSDDEDDNPCVPDSADEEEEEESDLDTPKPIIKPVQAQVQPPRPIVEATKGKFGQMVYQIKHTPATHGPATYFTCQWRKPQFKKHKTWDGDAYLRVEGSRVTLIDEAGLALSTSALNGGMLQPGQELRIGGKDIEVDSEITIQEFKKATDILNKNAPSKTTQIKYAPVVFSTPFKGLVQTHPPRPSGGRLPLVESTTNPPIPTAGPSRPSSPPVAVKAENKAIPIPAKSFYENSAPRRIGRAIVINAAVAADRIRFEGALHDAKAEDAIVMDRPDKETMKAMRVTSVNDVVVDPHIAAKLRDHQKEGVKFMYRCVMGMTKANANGCILADEMGLGKTLQTIALIWTLLRQSPYHNHGEIGKALIVCPVSLVANWKKEFDKWVGKRVKVVAFSGKPGQSISTFVNSQVEQVLIIGYEKLRTVIKQLAACVPQIGLIVCDEGHRLKSKDNKTTKMFDVLSTTRRIILSGTPVQNDLGEYWAMTDFCCPGLLSTYKAFAKKYEEPIRKSRELNCRPDIHEIGKERADELGELSKEYVLRRMANVLQNYLPPKYEYVLFIAPTKLQLDVYSAVLGGKHVRGLLGGSGGASLGVIDLLRKVSNSPMLLRKKNDDSSETTEAQQAVADALKVIPRDLHSRDVTTSGKLFALDKLLLRLSVTDEKIVLISNWTATLDLLAKLCTSRNYSYLRLDGNTNQKSRQENVDRFNRGSKSDSFVFLLSAKAGGVGLNLIGASRLVLFDSDWNPSTDLQAMARIHRDGQKRPVFLYRFLTTNTIDEKVYQRQLTKTGLSEQMLDQNQSKNETKDSFSFEELRAIFKLDTTTNGCQTHDLLGCDCCNPEAKKLREAWEAKSEVNDLRNKVDGFETDEESEDERKVGFVQASQYDPAPTQKQLKKAAKDQQDKLRQLKEWKHIDAFDDKSFTNIKDNILYNHFWEDWLASPSNVPTTSPGTGTGTSAGSATSSLPSWENDLNDEEDDDAMSSPSGSHREEKKKGLLELFDSVVNDSEPEDQSDPETLGGDDESDDNKSILPFKRKSHPTSTRSTRSSKHLTPTTDTKPTLKKISKGKVTAGGLGMKEKKYDLRNLADNGMGGRVMFVFEKISKSKM